MAGPLAGIRVVDFSRVLAGPHCTETLLDLGADVIKVEPPRGDLSRQAFPRWGEISGYYAQQNAGKQNLSIDLNVPGAREIVLRLCKTADVIVENFRPGTLESFGLGYQEVSAANPRVVYASISGYGQRGEWRSRMAYAGTVQAESGMTSNTLRQFGLVAGSERSDALSHADVYAGLHCTIAILAALRDREVTGTGQHIDVAMAAVMLATSERAHADLSGVDLGEELPILGADDLPFFISPEGRTFVTPVSLVGTMTFPLYLTAMRRPDLADDPRFSTLEARKANRAELHRIVQTWILTFQDMASLDAQLDEAKIASGIVRNMGEFSDTEWSAEWKATRKVPNRSGGEIVVAGLPWHFSKLIDSEAEAVREPALQGEHNTPVLTSLGFTPTQIDRLRKMGVIVQPSLDSDQN
jgi:crotonobetainyl-CoA:carnitine CoA-transferase CaiB-like acyl-CoA transferase